jgi:hypothetical protein
MTTTPCRPTEFLALVRHQDRLQQPSPIIKNHTGGRAGTANVTLFPDVGADAP